MDLYCKQCNYKLTPHSLKEAISKELSYIDEEELLKEGMYISTIEADYFFNISIDYLLNSKSTVLIDHQDSTRFNGCCGPSEFGKLNQICPQCKSEIGVLIADCWTSRFIGIDSNKVSKKPLW